MMSLSRIFGLMLLFFFFEAVVAVVATFAYPEVNVFVACIAMTALALSRMGSVRTRDWCVDTAACPSTCTRTENTDSRCCSPCIAATTALVRSLVP